MVVLADCLLHFLLGLMPNRFILWLFVTNDILAEKKETGNNSKAWHRRWLTFFATVLSSVGDANAIILS